MHPDPTDPLPGRGDRRERTARAAVLEHATGEHRRHFPMLLHVGAPLGHATVLPAEHGLDHALRCDVVGALIWRRRHEDPLVWLTRAGSLAWQDADAEWFAAWRAAAGEIDVPSRFLVVTRHGWHDPSTGRSRTWKRIRDRRAR
ncbi:MAG: hypothetical protein VX494_05965 [Actinomycetota bacterium]|nr:hypothetical protein [Actinomycetota bacterium]